MSRRRAGRRGAEQRGNLAGSLQGAAIAFALLASCSSTVYVPQPPPPSLAETPAPPPAADWIWIDGHWKWTGHAYAWVPGRWVEPREGSWEPGRWVAQGERWFWLPGHWRD